MKRRDFSKYVAALFATANITSPLPAAEESELGLLIWIIETFEPTDIASTMLAQPSLDVRALKRALNSQRAVRRRKEKAAQRRESHAGNVILYAGPLLLAHSFHGRVVLDHTRREILIGETDKEYTIRGIGVSASSQALIEDVSPYCQSVEPVEVAGLSSTVVTVPRGSRVLLNGRFGFDHDVWACEVVKTLKPRGGHRIHLWQTRHGLPLDKRDESLPYLAGGFTYSTDDEPRTIGLLGLPLSPS